jgi:hypothetical protein
MRFILVSVALTCRNEVWFNSCGFDLETRGLVIYLTSRHEVYLKITQH